MRRVARLGAYVPADTPVHRMDPRVKVGVLALAFVAAFGARTVAGVALLAGALAAALAASKTSPRVVLAGLKPTALVLALSLLANSLVLVGQPGFSAAGLARGGLAVFRIALMVGFALVVSSTTLPPALADALASLMEPLSRVGVPVGDVAMTVSLALRFVPITLEEVDRIRAAQRARGARLDEGGIVRRLALWAQVLVPLLVSLFRRADEVACAMCDRCYTGEGRTDTLGRVPVRDLLVLLAAALVCAAVFVL